MKLDFDSLLTSSHKSMVSVEATVTVSNHAAVPEVPNVPAKKRHPLKLSPDFYKLEPTEAERVGVWDEYEVMVTKRRAEWFTEQGLSEVDAEKVACRLVQRDRDIDDRSICLECIRLTRRGRCLDELEPIGGGGVNVLHRCPNFKDYGGF